MTQPNVFWTLASDLVNIVGLYSNVPSGGRLTDPQRDWLVHELKTLPKRVPIIVSLHHPPFSADTSHGGSDRMRQEIDDAARKGGRRPDAVFAGHVHAYERFTRRRPNGDEYPYIVAGGGGYHHLHPIARPNGRNLSLPHEVSIAGDKVSLESFVDDRHGFLRVEVTKDAIQGSYFTVPRPHESWSQGARLFEMWRYDLKARKVTRG
jgi:3',5'-cyclic AMP phosphodiesterase CpdA